MRELPPAATLADAVRRVIDSNKTDGYNPGRFISKTQAGAAPDLAGACRDLILKAETAELFERALAKYPTLLSLEDYVARHGTDWGFTEEVVETARARVKHWDMFPHGPRYS